MRQPIPDGAATDNAYLSLAMYGYQPGEGALQTTGSDIQIGLGPISIGGE
jgi:hypothetical protein